MNNIEEIRSNLIYILKYLGIKYTCNIEFNTFYTDRKITIFTSYHDLEDPMCGCTVYIHVPRKLWFSKKVLVFNMDNKREVFVYREGKWQDYIKLLKGRASSVCLWMEKNIGHKEINFSPIDDEKLFNEELNVKECSKERLCSG